MKTKGLKKYILFVFIFIVIIFLTFYTVFSKTSFENIINDVLNINHYYALVCCILIFLYYLLQGIYMKRNLKVLGEKITLVKATFYAIVEFFFSGITPSSTGGQPLQMYYMNKDKIPNKKALVTLILNTVFFKLVLVLFGIVILFFKFNMLYDISPLLVIFIIIGLVMDIGAVLIGYTALFKYDLLSKVLHFFEKIIKKFKKNFELKVEDKITKYSKEVSKLTENKKELIIEFIITVIQRLCLFSISYAVYRAFGLNEYSYFQIIIIQISVQLAVEFIPLPGGTGLSEYLFSLFYVVVYGSSLGPAAMIVTRTFSFYVPLLSTGIVVLIKYIKDLFITKKEQKENNSQ